MTEPTNEPTLSLPPGHAGQQPTVTPNPDPAATVAEHSNTASNADARAPAGYVIERELGRGGMGVVYLARSLKLDRLCALKMILSGAHSGDTEIERFQTEAKAIARLQHPGIVQVFEVGEHDGRPFMALEFCGGGSLDVVLRENPLEPRKAAELVRSLAEAMQAAHQANVIHRDLKPANVLLASGPREGAVSSDDNDNRGLTAPARLVPKITDFGLAKKLDEQGATRTGSIMGTPSYMPPEQADGRKDIGPAADIYSLGAILYECLAGRPPFRAATPHDTILQVIHEEPVPLRQLNAKVPLDLETIVHKCLQKDPRKRYVSAQDLADDLGRYLNGEPIQARPVGVVERAVKWVRRNLVLSIAAALVLLTLTAGVIVSSVYARLASDEAIAARKAEGDAREAEAAARALANLAQEQKKRAEAETKRAELQLSRAELLVYAGKLSLAQSAFAEGNGVLALQHLEECQWNLRGWEHRHLWTRFNSKQTLQGHTGLVTSVAWSPDGKKVFEWDSAGKVFAWDTATGQAVALDNPPARPAPGSAISPDGRVSAKPDGAQVRLIDLLQPAPVGSPWPLPDAAQRKRYHTEQAALAETEKKWFAVAFHVGRLLLDDPNNADLKKRREDARKNLAGP